ncbi:hypothetical protein ADK59_21505 [Streptomyces sp. XY332]|nr:hypothetical protein ADK59_21505 [Streptomyces sp. XY332]
MINPHNAPYTYVEVRGTATVTDRLGVPRAGAGDQVLFLAVRVGGGRADMACAGEARCPALRG